MKNQFLIFLFLAGTLFSCEKGNLIDYQDANYPTIINKLSTETLAQLKTSFAQKNKFVVSSLNQFGFCDLVEINNSIPSPPVAQLLTQPEAIAIVSNFASANSAATGVNNAADLKFSSINTDSGYYDGATYWYFRTANQRIDTIEVMYSQIIFHVKNREIHYCTGNWYPEVYIPRRFNIDRDKAKSSLLNYVVWHSTIAGVPYSATVSAASLAAGTTMLVVFPVITDDKIELRVTWQINIPGPVYYLIFVDVMTGEIIGEQPTIIS
jgi:hypothetical protein